MADRTSAALFGKIFKHLAKNPTQENKVFAEWLVSQTYEYDFDRYQMEADDALEILGLIEEDSWDSWGE